MINPAFHCIQIFKDEGMYDCTTFIDIDIEEPEEIQRTIWQVFTCVSVVKSILGINKYTVWTPYQLMQYLLKEKSHRLT